MCSIDGGALRRVAEAIDRLEADRRNTDAADLEARIAAVWSMVSEIDPDLARLASRYQKPEYPAGAPLATGVSGRVGDLAPQPPARCRIEPVITGSMFQCTGQAEAKPGASPGRAGGRAGPGPGWRRATGRPRAGPG